MIGAEENVVRQLAADEDVDVANINAPGQIVISGELAKVEAAVGVAKEYGIRSCNDAQCCRCISLSLDGKRV